MKTLIIFCITMVLSASLKAQGVIELKETKVEAKSLLERMERNGNQFSATIREEFQGEFQKNPISFATKNLDMAQFTSMVGSDYESFVVYFKSRKGNLEGHYDRNGNLIESSYSFKDVAMPYALIQQVYLDNTGWKLTKTRFIGHKRGDNAENAYYKVTMKNGKQKKNIKYPVSTIDRNRVASRF